MHSSAGLKGTSVVALAMRLTVNHPCLSLKLKALQKQLYQHSCLPGGNADRGCAALRASPLMRQAIPIFPRQQQHSQG